MHAAKDIDTEEVEGFGRPGSFSCPEHGMQGVERAWIERTDRGRHRVDKMQLACGHTMSNEGGSVHIEASAGMTQENFMRPLQFEAHDSGDGQTIYHCPFCGSGDVLGGHDGTVECRFCKNHFTVQVQPRFPSMPQTVNGQPMSMPGMPGEPQQPSWMEAQPQNYMPPGEDPGAGGGYVPPTDTGGEDMFQTSSVKYYLTDRGFALDESTYERHLALRHADDRSILLEEIRDTR